MEINIFELSYDEISSLPSYHAISNFESFLSTFTKDLPSTEDLSITLQKLDKGLVMFKEDFDISMYAHSQQYFTFVFIRNVIEDINGKTHYFKLYQLHKIDYSPI